MNDVREIPPLDPKESLKRKRERIAILSLLFLFLTLMVLEFRISRVSSTLPFVNSIFFFGLVNLNIIILILLLWLVLRNVGKLFIERRRNVLGSRLKTKLVVSFLSFSIIPTLVLFVISALYINTTFDKWFSIKIQNTLETALEITRIYYRGADQTTSHFSAHIAKGTAQQLASGRINKEKLQKYLESQRELLALDVVEYYSGPLEERVMAVRDSDEWELPAPRVSLDLLDGAFAGSPGSVIHHAGNGDWVRALSPVRLPGSDTVLGVVVVSRYVPVTLVNKVDEVSSVIQDYKDINPLKYPVKTAYFLILILITLVIIFVAIWIGLYMARELTVPVERLVKGAQMVGAGNLDTVIQSSGHDEIATLVESFNRMTADLKENRERLTEATRDQERRKIQLEAILANVGTGVISLDQDGRITTFNRAVSQLLEISPDRAIGRPYAEALVGEVSALNSVFEKAMSSSAPLRSPEVMQVNLKIGGTTKSVAAIATSLPTGAVVVIDDMTSLVKGQREMAWREVARRIAHEIKNPLTPIKLSAQRMQRKLGDLTGKEGQLVRECTETIIQHTDELKQMVNEFSDFARMPEVTLVADSLDDMIRETLSLYEQAHADVRFVYRPDSELPRFEFDRDQLKRVFINLFDNAVAALREKKGEKRIEITTNYHASLKIAVLDFRDNGAGMPEDVKSRVFEPYFSTKSDGTGLGLAIAKRIVADHHGFIRVQSSAGEGTQFTIELPTELPTMAKPKV
ncbi:MAG: HAMP domain-containing protein [Bdellovibrionales bacterium]|nr:HAMP domain-containing protein [Bdellovibrionales bacterium]